MTKAGIGDWVEISKVVLEQEERAPNLPPDTAAVPYTLRVRGFATSEGELGSQIWIVTAAGRAHTGKLEEVNPEYRLSHGESVPELVQARFELMKAARQSR
jgi:hypothetical protein